MRLAYNPTFLKDDTEKPYGISLGSDFCAEHEWGIKDIHRLFLKSDNKAKGLEKFIVHQLPKNFSEFEHMDAYCIGFGSWETITSSNQSASDFLYNDRSRVFKPEQPSMLQEMYGQITPDKKFKSHVVKDFIGAWDGDSFSTMTIGFKKFLKEIYVEMIKNNVILTLAGGGAFQNAGLVLAIYDKISLKILSDYIQKEESVARLQKFVDKSKIEKILEKAGKKYYALSPRWMNDKEDDVQFWLNPAEQHMYNYGWYGIEDLLQWAENRGPIMKKR